MTEQLSAYVTILQVVFNNKKIDCLKLVAEVTSYVKMMNEHVKNQIISYGSSGVFVILELMPI